MGGSFRLGGGMTFFGDELGGRVICVEDDVEV